MPDGAFHWSRITRYLSKRQKDPDRCPMFSWFQWLYRNPLNKTRSIIWLFAGHKCRALYAGIFVAIPESLFYLDQWQEPQDLQQYSLSLQTPVVFVGPD